MSAPAEVQVLLVLRNKLNARRTELSGIVAAGGLDSFDKYKAMTGKINGLTIACEEIDDMLDRLKQADD